MLAFRARPDPSVDSCVHALPIVVVGHAAVRTFPATVAHLVMACLEDSPLLLRRVQDPSRVLCQRKRSKEQVAIIDEVLKGLLLKCLAPPVRFDIFWLLKCG